MRRYMPIKPDIAMCDICQIRVAVFMDTHNADWLCAICKRTR